ncbi:helix-turn-helix transcriptional regulator, partial [Providencia manganoxydans]
MRERIKQARLAKNMTQAELAELVGVSPQSVQQWETSTEPRKIRVIKIAEILEVDTNWLLFGITDIDERNKVSSIQINQDIEVSDKNTYKVEMLDIQASAGPGVMVLDDFIET